MDQEDTESDDEYAFLKTSKQDNLSTIRSSVYNVDANKST